jgi:hypothetical protein
MFLSGQKTGSRGRLIFSDLVGGRDSGVRNDGIGQSEKQDDKKKDAQNWQDKMKQSLGVIRKWRRMRKTYNGGGVKLRYELSQACQTMDVRSLGIDVP